MSEPLWGAPIAGLKTERTLSAEPITRRRRRAQVDAPQDSPATTEPEVETQTAPSKTRPSRTRTAKPPAGSDANGTPATQFEKDLQASIDVVKGDAKALFETAPDQRMDPKKLVMPDMQHGFQTIVNDLFNTEGYDVAKEWEAVRAGLEFTDALTPEKLRRVAAGQEALADRAHRLYIVARVECNSYIRETEPIYGAMREQARESLEKAKAIGARTKQITDADVLGECARLFQDEWLEICGRREKAESMLKQLDNLAQLARARCYTVSNLASPGARFS